MNGNTQLPGTVELPARVREPRRRRGNRRLTRRIVDAISILERPASAEDRAVPGHWEVDPLCGSSNSYIVTLVERHTRYVLLAKVANRDSQSVITALINQADCLPTSSSSR